METIQDIDTWLDSQTTANRPYRYTNWTAQEKEDFHRICNSTPPAELRAVMDKYVLVVPNQTTVNLINAALPHWLKLKPREATDGTLLARGMLLTDIEKAWKGPANILKASQIQKISDFSFPVITE